MVRIRYNDIDGVKVSQNVFNGRTFLRARIQPDHTFQILDGVDVLSEGKGLSYNHAKFVVKHTLKDLGAHFDDEVRTKRGIRL